MTTVKRKRMYPLDPRQHKLRWYSYAARRHRGFTDTNEYGHSRARIVGHGYGKTPQEALLRARKAPKRRTPPEPKSARRLADDRRYSAYVQEKFRNQRPTGAFARRLSDLLRCEHEWVPTLPQTLEWSRRCAKCNAKGGGRKPGAPDSLRDYF